MAGDRRGDEVVTGHHCAQFIPAVAVGICHVVGPVRRDGHEAGTDRDVVHTTRDRIDLHPRDGARRAIGLLRPDRATNLATLSRLQDTQRQIHVCVHVDRADGPAVVTGDYLQQVPALREAAQAQGLLALRECGDYLAVKQHVGLVGISAGTAEEVLDVADGIADRDQVK